MADPKTFKIVGAIVGVLGLVMCAVAIWAMVAPYKFYGGISIANSDITGDSPKLALSAGVFSILLAAFTFFAKLDDKKHLGVLAFLLSLVLVLSIAAMAIAIKDINFLKTLTAEIPKERKEAAEQFFQRLKAIAVVCGISCIPQIVDLVFVGKSLV